LSLRFCLNVAPPPPTCGGGGSIPYTALANFTCTAFAASRITSTTKLGLESIGTWLAATSYVVAPIRLATARSSSGWTVRSLVATMYQLGFDLQATAGT
jgi:hypothetical protein